MWWKQKLDMLGRIFFRGSLPPVVDELEGIREAGVALTTELPRGDEIWRSTLRHPAWGEATLSNVRGIGPIPPALVEFSQGLAESERKQILTFAESSLRLEVSPTTDDSLRERKRLLRFMDAVLGRDGVLAVDEIAQTLWTRERLQDEIAHDAPLDIIQVHVLHEVTSDSPSEEEGDADEPWAPIWIHSHGLGEMGFVDFDIVHPSPELTRSQFDVLRSIAFHIVEGSRDGEIYPILGGDPVALVDAEEFMAGAAERDRNVRDTEFHTDGRVVCCDARPPGLLRRITGRTSHRPSRLLSRGMVEGQHLVSFSTVATNLMAERARETLELLEKYRTEFEDLQCSAIVKMGYATDSGSSPDDREHLWFEVHGTSGQEIDATLVNDPFDIERLSAGQRSRHSIELLTDWMLITPAGPLTPRTLEVARQLREARPQIMQALRETQATD